MDDPDLVVVYYGYGTENQCAVLMERAYLLLDVDLPSAFVDYEG